MIIEVTEDNLLTWELQLQREGTLPPEVQEALLAEVRSLNDQLSDYDDHYED